MLFSNVIGETDQSALVPRRSNIESRKWKSQQLIARGSRFQKVSRCLCVPRQHACSHMKLNEVDWSSTDICRPRTGKGGIKWTSNIY